MKDQHKQPRESFHLPQELLDDLKRYVEHARPRPGKSEVLRTALEEFLQRRGFRSQ